MNLSFAGSKEWYIKNQTQPAKNQPWYHVLVHDSTTVTYAAQASLEADVKGPPINHPLVPVFFTRWGGRRYIRNGTPWEW